MVSYRRRPARRLPSGRAHLLLRAWPRLGRGSLEDPGDESGSSSSTSTPFSYAGPGRSAEKPGSLSLAIASSKAARGIRSRASISAHGSFASTATGSMRALTADSRSRSPGAAILRAGGGVLLPDPVPASPHGRSPSREVQIERAVSRPYALVGRKSELGSAWAWPRSAGSTGERDRTGITRSRRPPPSTEYARSAAVPRTKSCVLLAPLADSRTSISARSPASIPRRGRR